MMSPQGVQNEEIRAQQRRLQDIEPFPWAHIIDQPSEVLEEESHLSPFYTRWCDGRPKSPKSAAEKLETSE